jgi:NSS family neurotransmitter:Na+ symporter
MTKENATSREGFTSKFGFIMSCIGSALGLGNIWMFSYKLGAYGGAAFLIPYFLFVFILSTTGLITEFTFGRYFKAGSYIGINTLFKKRNLKSGKIIGLLPPLGITGIFIFYCIVVGWVLKYFALSITGKISTIDTQTYFSNFSGTSSSIPWFLFAVVITLLIVISGVAKGIERLNKIVLPILFVIFIFLMFKSLSLEGAMEGVRYLVIPRWEVLLNAKTWIMALGQAFFTVSLTGCGMVVYGSYINKDFDIPTSSLQTAIFDTLAALLASFIIIPAVFAFNIAPDSGPSLLFITVPKVFQSMPYSSVISSLFFLSIIFAAISSSVSMLEGPVETLLSATNLTRKKATILVSVVCFLLGLPLAVNIGMFGQFADFITIVLSPIGVLIVAICFFYLFDKKTLLKAVNQGSKHPVGLWFVPLGKYVFVTTTILVIVLGLIYGSIG